jgi:tight adherence protein B
MTRAAIAAFERAQTSGAKPATALTRLAARARDEAHAEVIAAARRAGVLAVAPLGLCFLPAFLLLGVVPAVLGSLPGLLPA